MTRVHALVLIACIVLLRAPFSLAQDDTFPNEVETHIGKLSFDHGVPTEETSERLYYELDYHRAVQVYLWSLPIMGQAQWRQSYLDLYGMKPNQMVYAKQFNDRSRILTANESTPYLFGWTKVEDKAAVLEVPPGVIIGLGIDFWQRGFDYGQFGPNAGKGGTWVIVGPETPQSNIPFIEGATVVRSKTCNVWLVSRLSMPAEERDKAITGFKLYYYGEEPKAATIIPSENKPGRNYQPRGMKYWEMLHAILQEEPVEERDRLFMYFLKEMGIEKDKPFNPSEREREILTDAVVVGEAMAKNMVFRERLPGVLRDDGWRLIIGSVQGAEPGDAMENTQRTKYFDRFDPRARYTYEACITSGRMAFPRPGLGMGYGGMFLDSKGRALAGDRSYIIKVPPKPPVELFWAVTIYDIDTRGLITTDQQRAERGSAHEGIKTNPDGSTPIFVGPEAPAGWENNWIKSVPGRAWFPYFRFYGPTEPFFDQSWKLPQIEEIDFAVVAK